jgi:hypothetical protein
MPYLFLSTLSLFSIVSPRFAKRIRLVLPLLLFIFVAFAFGAGYDWIGYYTFYNCYQYQLCDTTALSIEPGFVFLLALPTPLGYQLSVFAAGLLIVVGLVVFMRGTRSSLVVVAYFVLMYGWYLYIEQIRQAMALSVLLIGVPYLLKGRSVPYLVSIAVAMLFHVSALTAVVPYLLTRISIDSARKWVGLITVTFIGVALSLQTLSELVTSTALAGTIVGQKLAFYAASASYNRAFAGFGLPIDIAFFWYISKFRPGKNSASQSELVFLLCQLFFLLLIFSRLNSILFRFTYYFAPFVALTLDKIVRQARPIAMSNWRLRAGAGALPVLIIVAYLALQNSRPFMDPVIGPSVFDYRWYPVHDLILKQSRDQLALERCDQLQDLGVGYLCGRS